MCKRTFNYNPIISIHLLHQQITIHSGCSDKRRISLDLLAAVNSAGLLGHILAKRFAAVFLIRRFGDIRYKAVGHFKRKYELFYGCGTCCTAVLRAERPSYRLQSLAMPLSTAAMPPCPRKCLAENMPCLVQFSAAAMSAKMPHRKYASSHPGSPYATKRGHASIATQLESFPLSVNSRRPTDHRVKSRLVLMLRQTLGRSLVTGSKQSANPLVSPRSK